MYRCRRQDHQASCSWTSPRRVWTQKPDGRSGTSSVRRAAAAAATPVQVARARTHDHVCVWLTEAEKANGRCMIITTHSMEEADVLCGRIGILHLGKLQCVGTQLRLKNRYGALRRSCFRMWRVWVRVDRGPGLETATSCRCRAWTTRRRRCLVCGRMSRQPCAAARRRRRAWATASRTCCPVAPWTSRDCFRCGTAARRRGT